MQIIENGLNNLGVHELRVIARNIGVKSPTTKKREILLMVMLAYWLLLIIQSFQFLIHKVML